MTKRKDSVASDLEGVLYELAPNLQLIRDIVKLEKDSIHRSELSVVARRAKIKELIDAVFAKRNKEKSA